MLILLDLMRKNSSLNIIVLFKTIIIWKAKKRSISLLFIEFYRAQVTVTDLEDLQTLLRVNIIENRALVTSGSVSAKVLKWFVLMFFIYSLLDLILSHISKLRVQNILSCIQMQTAGFPLFLKG